MNDPRRDDLTTEVITLKRQLQEAHVALAAKTHACFQAHQLNDRYRQALEKIADPRKRDHQEPDAYTALGCVMNIADNALAVERESKGSA